MACEFVRQPAVSSRAEREMSGSRAVRRGFEVMVKDCLAGRAGRRGSVMDTNLTA